MKYTICGFIGCSDSSDKSSYGGIITSNGCFSIIYAMNNPEAYSLSEEDLDNRHTSMYNALKQMPDGSYVHKQDVFVLKKYISESNTDDFILKAEAKKFQGREYLEHKSYLIYTLSELGSLKSSYQSNPLSFKEKLHKEDEARLSSFLETVQSSVSVINSIKDTSVTLLKKEEIEEYIDRYVNFFPSIKSDGYIDYAGEITIGSNKARYYTICDENYLPDREMTNCIEDYTLNNNLYHLYMSKMEMCGVHLKCNHVVNQLIYFEGTKKLEEQFSKSVGVYSTNIGWDNALKSQTEDLMKMQNEIKEEKDILCRCNFNVMIWSDEKSTLDTAENKLKEILAINELKCYIPSYADLANLHMAFVPGQEGGLDKKFLFMCRLSVGLCFFISNSVFNSDEEGVLFNDRLFQIPLRKDIWDRKNKRLHARNGMIVASTGGGKSVLAINILQQLLQQDCVGVVVEFGNSFENLCKMYKEQSIHVCYNGKGPLGLNPFELNNHSLDEEKLQVLTDIVQQFWQHKFTENETESKVAVTKFITDYYNNVKTNHSFPSFYSYIVTNFEDICERCEVLPKYFDIDSFKITCGDFLPGNRYADVCRTGDEYNFDNKNLIVFELTELKKNPFLLSIVTTMIFDVINEKILKDRGKRGMIIFDEYGEIAQMKDEKSNIDIHSTVAFYYQKIRKQNGAILTVVQTPDQLPDNEYTKGILANTQLLYVLPTTDVVYDSIEEKFKFSLASQKNLMRSMRSDITKTNPRKYTECFIRFEEQYAIVVRQELSREKLLMSETEGETYVALNKLYDQTNGLRGKDMENTIIKYLENTKN